MRLSLLFLFFICFGCSSPKIAVEIVEEPYIQPAPLKQIKPSVMNPVSKGMVVIDPGHGGDDLGTQSLTDPKYLEKHLNLATAQQLRNFLHQMGYTTVMTRNKDVFIALNKRAEFANERNPDLFISVHYNSAPSKSAQGIEVFYYRSEKDLERTRQSKVLAQKVLNKIIGEVNASSRGVKHGNFAVIRETQMPAILVEGGFLTNEEELSRIKDPSYMKKLAWAMAKGVDDYLVNR